MTTDYEYKVGGSLGENAPSYVVRQADFDLYHSLKAGEFCYIFNSRQMGKTSLIVRTMNKLQAEGFACTSLDFSVRGSRDIKSEQWYAGIVYKLTVNFNLGNPSEILRGWWVERGAIPPIERLEEFIETVLLASIQSKIVIFIDEIDSILSLGFDTGDFFALIRSCYEKRNFNPEYRRLTFALVGVVTPGDLIADKRRTPFNIGRAIQLEGFKDSEIEPLAKGFEGQIENPNALIREILTWTGGQPFLTQKICRLIATDPNVETRSRSVPKVNFASLQDLIQKNIIENWESHDEPEHIKTIRDRMLLGEQVAGRFLGWYQQILLSGYIHVDESIEQIRFRLTGLVVKQQNIIKVYNRIYESVLNLTWVEKELKKIRPYSENFQAWVDSNYQDSSRLLRGQALQNALQWATQKSLSNEDSRYLAASQELEKRELEASLAVQEEDSRILSAANETLSKAQKKSKRMIQFGSTFLAVSIIGAIIASVFASITLKELTVTKLEKTGINLLQEPFLGGEIKGLVNAMRAGRELKNLVNDKPLADYPTYSPALSLQYILSNIRERNQLQGHTGEVYSVAISADGKTLASAGADKTIKLWNISTGKIISTLSGHTAIVNSVAISADGKTLASAGADKTIKLWNISTGKLISTLSGHTDWVNSVAISADGKTLASAGADKTIKLWNISTGKLISTLSGHTDAVSSVAISADGKTLASAADKTIKLWNISTGKLISTLSGHTAEVYSVAISTDGKTLASAGADKTIKLWNISTGKLISTLSGHAAEVYSVAISPDGKTLASASLDKIINLWNISTGKLISSLSGHTAIVNSVAISPDGKTLASAGADKTIKLWNINTGKFISTLSGHTAEVYSVAISPDGKNSCFCKFGQNHQLVEYKHW
ncbi:AAA-like domain-containing protein [Dulcicalothrix desertica]|uniref:AAA-like domain-containing protein n=1 Tax=Dulcicalothrix desertica TaxID=32056 RepID=UPI00119AD688|nr:AAA-like domain-containing protein [Dulcicalothrix desertica]TWH43510.1 FOG: WD40 repeat [Dulcicalothrix desertica PCC 7102]